MIEGGKALGDIEEQEALLRAAEEAERQKAAASGDTSYLGYSSLTVETAL